MKAASGNTGWGECPRCNYNHDFVSLAEQCYHCGQVTKAVNEDFKVPMKNNRAEAYALMKKLRFQHKP